MIILKKQSDAVNYMKKLITLLFSISITLVFLLVLVRCAANVSTWQEQYDLGIRYFSEDNYEEAIIAFTSVIEIDPKNVDAYLGRAEAYIARGETEEALLLALKDYEKVASIDETLSDAYLGMADVYIRMGDYDKALEILQSVPDVAMNDEVAAKIAELEDDNSFDNDPNTEADTVPDTELPPELELEAIEVASMPTKTTYYVGEILDITGLTVNAIYNDDSTETIISEFACSPMELTSVGDETITVEYNGKTTTFNISVQEVTLVDIEIKSYPGKTTYNIGETLNTSGLALTAKYSNGSTKTITSGFTCSPMEFAEAGTTTVTVSYNDKTAKFDVNVEQQALGITWSIDGDTLIISGRGPMENYKSNAQPWKDYTDRITTVIIEDGITSIGRFAFYNCISLQSITIPESVTSIGEGAFYSCNALETITIPSNVTSIETGAFLKCVSLQTITIPGSVTSIGHRAFGNWTSNQTIYIKGRTSAPEGWDADWNENCSAQIVWDTYVSTQISYHKPVSAPHDSYQNDIDIPQLNSETDNAKSFNRKIADIITADLKQHYGDAKFCRASYRYLVTNGIVGILTEYGVYPIGAGGFSPTYTGFFFDTKSDSQLTYEEYLLATGLSHNDIAKAINMQDAYYNVNENDILLTITDKHISYAVCNFTSPEMGIQYKTVVEILP